MGSEFRVRAGRALSRDRVRGNIRRAMDGLILKRRAVFPDADELALLRDQGQTIRDHALANLPALLEQLEQRCTANGIQVHWAEDAAEANAIILGIMRRHDADAIIKGKSMVSEEIGLNAHLHAHGIEPIETDLGELIIQLADEHPSHIVAPAVHKDRLEIAELFREHFPDEPYSEDIERLTALARRVMRERFRGTRIGLSGVNFAVAETGTLCLVENEGNGRMSTTAPDVHIAITGIEKVVARLEYLAPLLTLLTRSATGQPVTTYVNMISGPRKPEERDGPREVHLVLARQRSLAHPCRPGAARDAALHPLRRLHEPLPGLHPHRRPRLRHRLSRPHRRDPGAAVAGPGDSGRTGPGIEPVRCLRRGLPSAHPDPAIAESAAVRTCRG